MGLDTTKLAAVLATSLSLCAASAAASPASADYPRQTVRLIVPYAAGGMTDLVARIVGQKLGEGLGQAVVVENKPGASTITGADFVAGARPDGYTLLVATNTTLTINPWLYKNLRYDAQKSFTPIALVAKAPSVIVVNPKVPANNIGELVELASARPGSLSYASYGNGSSAHLAGEMLRSRAGIAVLHVPYRGSAPAKTATMSGEVSMTFEPAFTAAPLIKSGQLKPIALMGDKRSPALPDVPTVAEVGYPGMDMQAWVGFVAPANVPNGIVARLAAEIRKVMADPEVQAKLIGSGAEPVGYYQQDFTAYMRDENARYKTVIEQAGIRAE
ncbi:tripartite tricarboxylate transporter substrate binding protein [Bordetella bronchiseptica]|uniref:Bug family tripartite tricarboxylate transporter substrate binding protein n=1 Tax=Bordetella bronchiseptica TaxID=518 RepID=UPI00028FF4C6|nr:tripartite tricarboxylate transporter substrate binding protein [Bordetella bronchiseptica]AZW11375.1 tripartite tricarboxylate transporter substrate binding protein [Bordetella bronchiseptica]KDC58588.1 tripartite tricarboxylate transporter family receptor [Bordetella bronchiseptica MBORD595]KDC69412.1 tripartite tricarboxylate transporter family receptor [Bordetella bronchiseptica MBORD624]KDD61028.1 tripartite tricarboxylate transporter family receptor [Bordetella bronchiseptica SO10328]